jgi:small subunit ribosomal protein S8
MSDPIADMFIRIKNAQAVHHETVIIPASHLKERIANVLKDNGYINSVTRKSGKPSDTLEITLRYEGKVPAVSHLKRVSKPGARRYSGVVQIPRPLSGHGLAIVSTPQGIMSGNDAQKRGIGGEIIATVW